MADHIRRQAEGRRAGAGGGQRPGSGAGEGNGPRADCNRVGNGEDRVVRVRIYQVRFQDRGTIGRRTAGLAAIDHQAEVVEALL